MKTGLLFSLAAFVIVPLRLEGAAGQSTTAAPAAATTTAAPAAATTTAAPAAATTTAAPAAATTTAAPAAETAMTPEETIETASRQLEALSEDDVTIRIMLDPGHGGDDSGAGGFGTSEKKVALKIAKALAAELQTYDNVVVGLTRDKDKFVGIHKRTRIARKQKADLMISLHCDAYDPSCLYDHGSSVLVARKGSYKTELVTEENRLARSILAELEGLGLTNQGLVRRASAEGDRYEDGSLADYYGLIRDGMLYDFPVILVEHCFMDSKKDYELVLSSKEKIKKLAEADARGIAKYLGLTKKGSSEIAAANVRKGKELRCTGKKDSFFTLQKKVYNLNLKRRLEAAIADARRQMEQAEQEAGKSKESKVADSDKAAVPEQVMSSEIQSTDRQDKATESLAISFALALLAYYGLVTLREKNRRMHG